MIGNQILFIDIFIIKLTHDRLHVAVNMMQQNLIVTAGVNSLQCYIVSLEVISLEEIGNYTVTYDTNRFVPVSLA